MAAHHPVHPTINDELTKVQLRLLKQRLEKEREQTNSIVNQGRSTQPIIDEKYNHLKEAAFQRKELLDRLKHEQQLSRQLLRPRSNPEEELAPRRHRPNRRTESQPQLTESRRHGEMNYYPVRLQPIEHAPLPPPALPPVPSYPLPISTYQYIQPYQVAPPQNVSQQQPASNSRSDMYEMMMMQNAQMHQMIMQQLMLNSIQPRQNHNSTNSSSNNNSNDRDRVLALDLDDIRKLLKTSREGRRPPVYPNYRYSQPYAGYPPIVPTYHRPMEAAHLPTLMVPGNIQPPVNPETVSHLRANYLRQQKELDDEVPA